MYSAMRTSFIKLNIKITHIQIKYYKINEWRTELANVVSETIRNTNNYNNGYTTTSMKSSQNLNNLKFEANFLCDLQQISWVLFLEIL